MTLEAIKRHLSWQAAINALAAIMSLFHLYVAFFGPPEAMMFRIIHLTMAMALVFLVFPAKPELNTKLRLLTDGIPLLASMAATGHLLLNYDYVVNRMAYFDPLTTGDMVFGIALIILIFEATRRVVGLALPITATMFLTYALAGPWLPFGMSHGGFSFEEIVEQLYLTTEGILGIPVSVSATFVVLFVMFGAFLQRVGTGELFMSFAMALTGRSPGGPAKVACLTSGLFGTVSGSAVSNVMTTGVLTIPLMKRIGYKPPFAGAVEAVASTGGQIMPPIMGAAAFVMAEFLGVSFLTVATFALIPAVLFYVALFLAVHFEAKRTGMTGLSAEEVPNLRKVLVDYGHLFLPMVIIIGTLIAGFSAPKAAFYGIVSVFPIAFLRPKTRGNVTFRALIDSLALGAKNSLAVALACACAGIVIGVISQTGLGITFTALVIDAAQNSLVPALMLTMLAGIILGMGLPTTPAYIMQVALLVPALVKLGVMTEAAHMFVFYFAILSSITPPVALAVFAANSISGARLIPAGIAALKLGATGYIVPYFFVFGPALLMIGGPLDVILSVITALIGVVAIAAALNGFLFVKTPIWQRLFLVCGAIALIASGWRSDLAGLLFLAPIITLQTLVAKRQPEPVV